MIKRHFSDELSRNGKHFPPAQTEDAKVRLLVVQNVGAGTVLHQALKITTLSLHDARFQDRMEPSISNVLVE